MLHSYGRLSFILFLAFLSSALYPQEIAPYSRFGLGELSSPGFTAAKGMAGLGGGYRSPLNINFQHPASYSNLALTTMDFAANFNTKRITDGITNASFNTGDGFLDYLAFGIPITSSGGSSFGLVPYSKMRYRFTETKFDDNIGEIDKTYEGDGRVYQLYVGGAYRYPNSDTSNNTISLGVNFSYIFGRLNRQEVVNLVDQSNTFNTRTTSLTHIKNTTLNIGLQYRRKIQDELSVVLGGYGYFPVTSASKEDMIWDRFWKAGAIEIAVDTICCDGSTNRENVKIPTEIGFGLTFDKSAKWKLGADFSYSIWSDFENLQPDAQFHNAWRLGIGGEIRPDFASTNFFKKNYYRLGGFYDSGYLQLNETDISQYGITFGIGVPVKYNLSMLDFSFEIGKDGTTKNNLIDELFFRAYVGFTLNDRWFIKRKYD